MIVGFVVLVFLIALAFLLSSKGEDGQPAGLPEVPEGLKKKVAEAEEKALTAKVEARVQAAAQKTELASITKIEDGTERRKRLAEMLTRL